MGVEKQGIAGLIAERLMTGIVHPGDGGDQKAMPIVLPMFKTAGMAPEMREQIELTTKLLGEAIIALIEGEGGCEIVPKSDAARMRLAGERDNGHWARVTAVHCRCDKNFTDPLLLLTVTDDPRIVVSGKQVIKALAKRPVECPHM